MKKFEKFLVGPAQINPLVEDFLNARMLDPTTTSIKVVKPVSEFEINSSGKGVTFDMTLKFDRKYSREDEIQIKYEIEEFIIKILDTLDTEKSAWE